MKKLLFGLLALTLLAVGGHANVVSFALGRLIGATVGVAMFLACVEAGATWYNENIENGAAMPGPSNGIGSRPRGMFRKAG